ncbi:TetR/AcrR family transcriptional regulator [Paenibacillus sp. J5C_2022]|uniref:TetR/AcrR family transcriptional regulator n=1 Tax=Paenibacillus sp. J5C2022 TaxID=2977129 RepID=UPI0021CEEB30|nr:TetR/AcrR family transcriptional regulator [Paenibacillus sp. J5C2022]MCU6708261.1 TetR/AcrR family transcriptional regulator [Paenibacillus sp. J5C2022]
MSQALKEAALRIFSDYGYEGASLAGIADEVGLKKQSIYAHFKGKDDLFLQVFRHSFTDELDRLRRELQHSGCLSLHDCLYGILQSYIVTYQSERRLKFCLRVSFYPPPHLYEEIDRYTGEHLQQIHELFLERFREAARAGDIGQRDPETANLAFMALVDAICIELVYSDKEKAERRMEAAWSIFWDGLRAIPTTE